MYDIKTIPEPLYYSLVDKSESLLKDKHLFLNQGLKMISTWVISSEENLTKSSINKRAWIGQATCSFTHKANDIMTKEAWARLTFTEKVEANKIADLIIKEYERQNRKIHQNMGEPLL